MSDLLIEALDRYRDVFDDIFPMSRCKAVPEEEVLEMINKCIAEKKDVEKMGFVVYEEGVVY